MYRQFVSIFLVLLLGGGLTLVSAVSTADTSTFQIDPTQQQQTIDAVVQQRLQATAQAGELIAATQTSQAILEQSINATASFRATSAAATASFEAVVNAGISRAATATAEANLWDVTGARLSKTFELRAQYVWSIAFSPDSTLLASASDDEIIRIWDVESGGLHKELDASSPSAMVLTQLNDIAFSHDGEWLLSVGSENRLWNVDSGEWNTVMEDDNIVLHLEISPDGSLLATSEQFPSAIGIWDFSNHPRRLLSIRHHHPDSIAFSPDGTLLATATGDWIELWDVSSGEQRLQFEGGRRFQPVITFSPDGASLAVAGQENNRSIVHLLNAVTGRGQTLSRVGNQVADIAFSPDGRLLATAVGDVILWDVSSGAQLGVLEVAGGVSSVTFSPDGKYMAGAAQSNFRSLVHLWEIRQDF